MVTVHQTKKMLASHNSWTYLPPVWWQRPFAWVGRCQRENIMCQNEDGVAMFDLRVRFNCDGQPYPCHGLIRYDGDIFSDLRILNSIADYEFKNIYVRVLLEDDWLTDMDGQDTHFKAYCSKLEQRFPHLIFFGGHGTHRHWHDKYYDFKSNVIVTEKHASVCGDARWYEKIIPWLYARRKNAAFRKEGESGWLMLDFVDV